MTAGKELILGISLPSLKVGDESYGRDPVLATQAPPLDGEAG